MEKSLKSFWYAIAVVEFEVRKTPKHFEIHFKVHHIQMNNNIV